MNKFNKDLIINYISEIIDNRGKNPKSYFIMEKYPVIDNFLIQNEKYPNLNLVTRYLNQNLFENFLRNHLKKDDVLMTLVGNGIGNVTMAPSDNIAIVQNTIGLRCNNRMHNSYLYYHLLWLNKTLRAFDRGGAQPSINKNDVLNLEINVPLQVKIQEKIATILSNYDDLIENNNRRIKILEEMAQKIYKEWFVDFKFPGHETATFKDSELGKIPNDWEIKRILDFGTTVTGKTPSKNNEKYYGNDVFFIKTPDMHDNVFCLNTNEKLSVAGADSQKNKYLPINSICISCIGTVGVVTITNGIVQTNQQINSIIPEKQYYREYLYLTMSSLKNRLENIGSNGATMTNVNKNKFDNIQIIKPNDKIFKFFSNTTYSIFEQIKNLSLKNETLKQTRDILLPRLISGEIDVENLEIK